MNNVMKLAEHAKECDFYFSNQFHKLHVEGSDKGVFVCYSIPETAAGPTGAPTKRMTVIRYPVRVNWFERWLGVSVEYKMKAKVKKIKTYFERAERNRLLAKELEKKIRV